MRLEPRHHQRRHEGQCAGCEHNRVRGVHDRRTQQHAHGVQIVGRARHDIADSCPLIIGVGQRFEMAKQVVTQIELDLARDADENPSHQELEHSLC